MSVVEHVTIFNNMFEFKLSILLTPINYHMSESLWLWLSLDQCGDAVDTYGLFVISLGFTLYGVLYRNSFLPLMVSAFSSFINTVKPKLTYKTTYFNFIPNMATVKQSILRLLKR